MTLATLDDLPELEPIDKECDENFTYDPECELNHDLSLKECLTIGDLPPGGKKENYRFYCIRHNDTLIGFVSYYLGYGEADTAYICVLYIKETHRKDGAGAEILEALIEKFKTLQMKEVRLHCSLRNALGLRFWVRNGFERIITVECDGNLYPENFGGLELAQKI
jgi:GNAT superfamily N-acetyltransferase